MGWKSTKEIGREEAINLIYERISEIGYLSNEELGNILEGIGYGEDRKLPYYGYNFSVS